MHSNEKATMYTYPLPTVASTLTLGAQIAHQSPQQCVIFLKGPLGSGKTTFARGFLQALGDFKRIKSPTYTLVETYTTAHQHILHFDLYRLKTPDELEAFGIRDYTRLSAIWLIEWPEQGYFEDGSSLLPSPDLILTFELLPIVHQVTLEALTERGHQLVATIGN